MLRFPQTYLTKCPGRQEIQQITLYRFAIAQIFDAGDRSIGLTVWPNSRPRMRCFVIPRSNSHSKYKACMSADHREHTFDDADALLCTRASILGHGGDT